MAYSFVCNSELREGAMHTKMKRIRQKRSVANASVAINKLQCYQPYKVSVIAGCLPSPSFSSNASGTICFNLAWPAHGGGLIALLLSKFFMEHEHLVEQYVGEEKTRNTSQLESVGGYASVTSSISTWEALLVHLLESWEHHSDTSSIIFGICIASLLDLEPLQCRRFLRRIKLLWPPLASCFCCCSACLHSPSFSFNLCGFSRACPWRRNNSFTAIKVLFLLAGFEPSGYVFKQIDSLIYKRIAEARMLLTDLI